MVKHTQAHMSRKLNKNQPLALKERTKSQMEYYMGAKLLEIGVNPKSAICRWSLELQGSEEVWTYSAFWGESKEQLLLGQQPLQGAALLNCARANTSQELAAVAQLCGYGKDFDSFQEALKQAKQQATGEIESGAS